MENFSQIFSQLRDSSGEFKSNIHLLDEIVPVEEQMEYFQYARYIHSDQENHNIDRNYLIANLFSPDIAVEDRRHNLSVLAGILDVAAYRAIEAYHRSPLEPELTNWSALALAESKILLDTDLSGEKQYFVSTGLGGKHNRLRFFVVIASIDRSDLTDLQQQILLRELQFTFERNNIEMESYKFKNNFMTISILSDINHDAQMRIEEVVDECNIYGGYLDPRFLFTNIKQLEDSKIEELLSQSEDLTNGDGEDQ